MQSDILQYVSIRKDHMEPRFITTFFLNEKFPGLNNRVSQVSSSYYTEMSVQVQ